MTRHDPANRLFRRGRAGATVLEMAVALMVLLYLSFGTVEFGYFFFVKNAAQAAAREGARVAITPGSTNTDVQNSVNASLTAAGLRSADFAFNVKVNGAIADASTAASGEPIEVTVSGTWQTVGMRPLGLIGATKTVLGGATMRREG